MRLSNRSVAAWMTGWNENHLLSDHTLRILVPLNKIKKLTASGHFNWLLGIGAALGPRECDVEVEAVIGGQSGIIRGGRTGLKLPKEQPASDLPLKDAHQPSDFTMHPGRLPARQWQVFPVQWVSVQRSSLCVKPGRNCAYRRRLLPPPLGAEQADFSVSGGFF